MNTLLPAVTGTLLPADQNQLLAALRPAWEELSRVEDDYVRKCAVVGLMLNSVSTQVPHGEFGAWLHRNLFPEAVIPQGKKFNDLPYWRMANRWMKAAENVVAISQIGHVSSLTAVELSNAVLGSGRTAPTAEIAALLEQITKAVDGKTLAQLTFKFPNLDLAAGGDREWASFLQSKHPELIVDGKVPKRGKVGKQSKEILEEFSAWLNAKMKPRTPKQKQEAARALLTQIDDVLGAAVRNSVLAVLSPEEFVGTKALTSLWVERLKGLMAESRK